MHVRIIATPPGEAPLDVREAWVGLLLPLVDEDSEARASLTSGVLTGPKSFLSTLGWLLRGRAKRVNGYRVNALVAIGILEKHAPEAARWWQTHSPSRSPNRLFMFHAEVCEIVADGPAVSLDAEP